MTDQERAIWAETMEALRWLYEEKNKIIDEQERAQGSEYRIDDPRNRAAFKEVHAELARRMKEIGKKYGLDEANQ